jgi:8-oxo-dGTP pyrophosphatase MutT (NUDIX family)
MELQSTPMRTSHGSFALITRRNGSGTELLTQWNERWKAFSFVGGHKGDAETFRDCLSREVSEELTLIDGKDFRVGEGPVLHTEYTAWSHGAKAETVYKHEIYLVELVAAKAEGVVTSSHQNRWLTEDEIIAGMTHDGRAVSSTVRRILSQISSR